MGRGLPNALRKSSLSTWRKGPGGARILAASLALMCLAGGAVLAVSSPLGPGSFQQDFRTYYYAGKAFSVGENPYDANALAEMAQGTVANGYVYPPATLWVFRLLASLDSPDAYFLFSALKVTASIALVLLWKAAFLPDMGAPFILFCLVAFNSPIYADLRVGNISIIEQLLIWLAFVFLLKRRLWPFCLLILVAASFKVVPILFLTLLVFADVKGKYRSLFASLALFLAIHLTSLWTSTGLFGGFLRTVVAIDERGPFNPSTLSLMRDGFDLLSERTGVVVPEGVQLGLFLAAVSGIIVLSWRALAMLRRSGSQDKERMSVFFLCMAYALVVPRMSLYSFILLLVPTYYLVGSRGTRGSVSPATGWLGRMSLVAAVALLSSVYGIASAFGITLMPVFGYSPLVVAALVWGSYLHEIYTMPSRDPELSRGLVSEGSNQPSPLLHRVMPLRPQRARARRVPKATSDSAPESRPFPSKNGRNLRIAIFHLGFFYSGGGEKLVLEEMRGLRDLGHEVECFAPIVDRDSCFPELMADMGVRPLLRQPPRWLPMRDILWIILSCILIPFMAPRFRSYDVLLGANQPGPWFAWVLSKILRKPYAVYLNQPNRLLYPRPIDLEKGLRVKEADYKVVEIIRRFATRFIRWADNVSVRDAHALLTDGEYIGSQIRSIYGRPNTVCPAGCHPLPETSLHYGQRFTGSLQLGNARIRRPYVLLTNRHCPQKRFEYALWGLKMIRKECPDLSLVITGQETAYTVQLRYLADGLGLGAKVRFVGLVTEKDLSNLYSQAALYVYTSPDEDFGMGILEAMAHGTPVVAWNHGGPTVTVRHGETGFLIEPSDTQEFAESLLKLVTDPGLAERMGRAGHLRASELFSYERHSKMLEQALTGAVRSHAHVPVADATMDAEPGWVEE